METLDPAPYTGKTVYWHESEPENSMAMVTENENLSGNMDENLKRKFPTLC